MRLARRRRASTLSAVAAALLLAACGGAEGEPPPGSRDGASGLRLSGTVEGRQVAVREGSPELVLGDCDPGAGRDDDLCVISQTVGGELFVLVVENPDVLRADADVEVAGSSCRGAQCEDVTDHAVVDVQLGDGSRMRAEGGELRMSVVEPFLRYRGRVRLELPDGRISGEMDVVPRSD